MIGYDFLYENKRLRDFGFIMAKPEEEDSFGLSREILKGSTTAFRSVANHYGTQYSDTLKIPFFIIKDVCNNTDFDINRYELRQLQAWLTSSKIPKTLNVETFEHEIIEYVGIFTDVTPFKHNKLNGLYLTFTCDSSYAYANKRMKVECKIEETRSYFCDSDELNEEIYPTVTIAPNNLGVFSIENLTTGKIMEFSFDKKYEEILIDCKHKRIIADGKSLSLGEVGLNIEDLLDYNNISTGVFKIYFLRLVPGNNKLKFTGNGTFYVNCKIPMKTGGF